jgi:RNA polymerase sigma-70 factor (ECF subfamily)
LQTIIYRMSKLKQQIIDEILVMDAQDGSRRAMDMLVRRWQKRLWKHAFRLTCDQDATWDVTQQSWLGILKGLGRLHDPAYFKAWAYRVTTNKSIDWLKKRKALKQMSLEELHDPPQARTTDTGVRELLDRLDVRKKAVLCLYYFEQLSVPEISMALNIPKGTVKSRLHSARNDLKKLWEKHFG